MVLRRAVVRLMFRLHQGAYVTGRLEDSGRQNDQKMSRETVHSQSYATFFRHSAVLLRKLSINGSRLQSQVIMFC